MSKKPVTHTVLILDQSGSMESTRDAAVQSYNEQVQQVKINSKDQDIFCSLVTFNGEVFEHIWCEPAENLNEAKKEDYKCDGATAMRDAIGYTVKKLVETTDQNDENVSYLVVIISDGEENSSRHFKRLTQEEVRTGKQDPLKALMEQVQKSNRWTFTYMGCDEEYIHKVSQETAIPIANCAKWSNATPAAAARGLHCNKVGLEGFYRARAKGATKSANVYSADVECLADFTDDAENTVVPTFSNIVQPAIMPTINILNTSDPQVLNAENVNILNGGATPFSNKAPVNWKQ